MLKAPQPLRGTAGTSSARSVLRGTAVLWGRWEEDTDVASVPGGRDMGVRPAAETVGPLKPRVIIHE